MKKLTNESMELLSGGGSVSWTCPTCNKQIVYYYDGSFGEAIANMQLITAKAAHLTGNHRPGFIPCR